MILSIITINLNNSNGLKDTIESVINQSFKNFEYIVIDGGSTDDSLNIIKENADKLSFWISEKDNGIYDGMNKGIKNARGEFLMFMNSGDCLLNNEILNLCNKYMLDYPETDIFYGDIIVKGKSLSKSYKVQQPPVLDIHFLQHKSINHQASLIKAYLFDEFGLYPLEYKLASDQWFYLMCMISDKVFFHIDQPLVIYDADGISHTKYDEYKIEHDLLWKKLAPAYVQQLTAIISGYKRFTGYKIIKIAGFINEKIQRLLGKS